MKKSLLFLALALSIILALPDKVSAAAVACSSTSIGGVAMCVSKAINIAMGGVVAICWAVVAFFFLTAWGNPERLGTAKKAFIWAVVGTVILVLWDSIFPIIQNTFMGT